MTDSGHSVRLLLDSAPLLAAIRQLGDPAKLPEDLRNRFIELVDDSTKLGTINLDLGATPVAGELRYVFEPSPALHDLVAAAGAGDFKDMVIGIDGHDGSCP